MKHGIRAEVDKGSCLYVVVNFRAVCLNVIESNVISDFGILYKRVGSDYTAFTDNGISAENCIGEDFCILTDFYVLADKNSTPLSRCFSIILMRAIVFSLSRSERLLAPRTMSPFSAQNAEVFPPSPRIIPIVSVR